MKKYILYSLILLQIIIIATLIFLFEQIDTTGKEITIQTKAFEYEPYLAYDSSLYVDYDINEINEETWTIDEDLDYNTDLYVLLQKDNDGLFQVSEVALKDAWSNTTDDRVVLRASYGYYDRASKTHFVHYQLEELYHVPESKQLKQGDKLKVTWKVGKWGQFKLVDMEKVN
ncbi:MAG TPA: GDYXXLXY domain-containing protein [Pseudogracilibacillus sp.]|nr:GDYXXLXY domain-containing protein [Pseudogracilibacillus sp.]